AREGACRGRGKTILRARSAAGEPGIDHPPADRALQPAEREDAPEARPPFALDPAAPQEPQERQQEHDADQPAEQTVRPLPPIDGLELPEPHAAVDLLELPNGLLLLEPR